ncbi:MAG TPA: HD domain-containing protein [Desulfuromonadales bacterium]|nr:HD domain-containing protein [Desulfuromonadales bacterium]
MTKSCPSIQKKFNILTFKVVFVWTEELLARYLSGEALEIVREHSRYVMRLALQVAGRLQMTPAEMVFIEEAAMLHDIGVCQVNAPSLGLYGTQRYIMHGVLGRLILEQEGYPLHALVCERHTGVGITSEDIVRQKLPLPERDMCPISLAEQVICFADLFYSKKPGNVHIQKSIDKIRGNLAAFGQAKVQIFEEWLLQFGTPSFKT